MTLGFGAAMGPPPGTQLVRGTSSLNSVTVDRPLKHNNYTTLGGMPCRTGAAWFSGACPGCFSVLVLVKNKAPSLLCASFIGFFLKFSFLPPRPCQL